MGLTLWKGDRVLKRDASTAKNYLDTREIDTLNRITVMFLDQAENSAPSGGRTSACAIEKPSSTNSCVIPNCRCSPGRAWSAATRLSNGRRGNTTPLPSGDGWKRKPKHGTWKTCGHPRRCWRRGARSSPRRTRNPRRAEIKAGEKGLAKGTNHEPASNSTQTSNLPGVQAIGNGLGR